MKFSVVIPTRNRPERLAICLRSFQALDYPAGAWELIVVNDGGERSFTAVSNDLTRTLPLQMITIEPSGPAAARNAGAARAKGTYLAFTDDDCRVFPDWLMRFERLFAREQVDGWGGLPVYIGDGWATQAAQHLTQFLLNYLQNDAGQALLLFSNNLAYRRDVFLTGGGFDDSFPWAAAEDMELCHRMLTRGFKQRFAADVRVWHDHPLTARGHIRQQFRYGRGGYFFAEALKELPLSASNRPKAARSFYGALLRSLRRERLPLPGSALLLLGQAAYRLGRIYQRMLVGYGREGR